uniref:(northern house mosquito) hypothetical protein n=1 Tax=Culex pipiens TaxID=7175 RepID=A0A8D8HC93_CULPI
MKRLVVLVVATVVHLASGTGLSALHDSSSENRASSAAQYCTDLNPQTRLDIEQIMGLWYGSEVITHLGNEDGETIYDSCVVIHLTDTTNTSQTTDGPSRDQGPPVRFATDYGFSGDRDGNRRNQNQQNQQQQQQNYNYQWQQQQQNTRHLLLIWEEKEHTLEYKLRFNKSRPGFWMSSGPQEGTMIKLPYVHFSGTVQVLKAVNNQLVLTFCQSLPGSQLFTVVLSRQPMGLSPEENHSIRGLLKRRNLSTNSVRKVCYNDASSTVSSHAAAAILVGITTLLLRAATLFN